MAALFLIIVILVLILTGTIVPVLIFGGWAVVVILILVLIAMILIRGTGLIARLFASLGEDIRSLGKGQKFPKPNDPDYGAYLDWANRTGEFASYRHWSDVKRALDERRNAKLG
jgi:hypothetical protein